MIDEPEGDQETNPERGKQKRSVTLGGQTGGSVITSAILTAYLSRGQVERVARPP